MVQMLTPVAKIISTVSITVLAEKSCNILNTSAFQIHQLYKHTCNKLMLFDNFWQVSHIASSWPGMKIFSPEDPKSQLQNVMFDIVLIYLK